LDDVCAAAAAGSDTLYRFDAAFKELAADIGVEPAPRDDHDKSFAPCTAGVVFGVHYDTVAWTWAIPDEKLARTCMLLEEAIAAGSMAAKQIRSLVGKLIHISAYPDSSNPDLQHCKNGDTRVKVCIVICRHG
jgi:hypothetical protein